MLLSSAVIVAPGGVGTMLELFYAWQLVQVKHSCTIPIILLGDMWRDFLRWLEKKPLRLKFFDREEYRQLFLARTWREAVKMIDITRNDYAKGGKDFCINLRKYKYRFK